MESFKFKTFSEIEELVSILNIKDGDTKKIIKDGEKIDTGVVITPEYKNQVRKQLEDYYGNLRKYILGREFTNADSNIIEVVRKYRWLSEKAGTMLVKAFTKKNAENIVRGLENIPDGPVIFLSLHRTTIDNFLGIKEIGRPAPILHGATVRPLLLKAQKPTGIVPVEKGNQESETGAKMDVCKLLMNGVSVWVYSESTHNASPNKLWFPEWSWGALDMARISGASIVPVVKDYDYEMNSSGKLETSKTFLMFGKPISVGIEEPIYKMAEEVERQWWDMHYETMQYKSLANPRVVREQYAEFLKQIYYPGLKLAGLTAEYERNHIRGANSSRYVNGESFVNDVPIDKNGNLVAPNVIPGQFTDDGTFIPGDVIGHEDLCPESATAFPDYMPLRINHESDELFGDTIDPNVHQYKVLRRVPPKKRPENSDTKK